MEIPENGFGMGRLPMLFNLEAMRFRRDKVDLELWVEEAVWLEASVLTPSGCMLA
jgi:hypothetical protein